MFFFLVCVLLLSSSFVYTKHTSEYCDPTSTHFQNRNQPQIQSAGKWSMNATIFVLLEPGIPPIPFQFFESNVYDEDGCQFNSTLMYYIQCDATVCPSIPSGIYVGLEQINAAIIIPHDNEKKCNQRYRQVQVTTTPPTITDVGLWHAELTALSDDHNINIYKNKTTGQTLYDENILIISEGNREYTTRTIGPSLSDPSMYIVQELGHIQSTSLTVFPEPFNTALNLYINGTYPYLEYAPGQKAYLLALF